MRSRSLRFKLGWNHGLIISVVFLCIGIIRYATVSYRAQRSFDQDLLRDAEFLVSYFIVDQDDIEWRERQRGQGDSLLLAGLRPFFVITDENGEIVRSDYLSETMREMLAQRRLESILKGTSGYDSAEAPDGTALRFVHLPLRSRGGPAQLYLHLGRSMEPLHSVLEEYFFIWASSIPVVLIVSVVVGWFLAWRALRPFEDVSRTAKQITSENLNTQIVTERREEEILSLVQSFNAMVARLDRSFEQMRRFNADVAHELRTPLAILQGENEIALRSGSLGEETRSLLASNLEELERLGRLVNDLLTLADADAGSQVMVKKPIDLRPLLEDLVEQMRLLALERNIPIELRELPDARLEADELWIRRAILNLLDNAIKYSRDGGAIQVRAHLVGNEVCVEIADRGIGIRPGDLPFIFDRLFRSESARSGVVVGRGLGLSLVKWVVEAHGGRIRVSSQVGRGSTFQVILPFI